MFNLTPLRITWKEVQTTGEPCATCEEPIYGKQYQQYLNNTPTDQRLCEPCYELVKKEQKRLDARE